MYSMAEDKIEKIAQIYQTNLMDYLQLLTYLQDKAEAEEAEEKYQNQLRKNKQK